MPKYDQSHRRSLSDLIGIFVTYFPEKENKEGILDFIHQLSYRFKSNNIRGHYCSTPKKVVFSKGLINYDTTFGIITGTNLFDYPTYCEINKTNRECGYMTVNSNTVYKDNIHWEDMVRLLRY